MPDSRKHRGKHPADFKLFCETRVETLRTAVAELSWLRGRGYADVSAVKLVGDRHGLAARQRAAVMRCSCTDAALRRRAESATTLAGCCASPLGIDGYNLLITVECALAGGLILIGRDGCFRDLAGVHGTYRKVEETVPALTAIMNHLDAQGTRRIDWYLDRPVSNSGRLKALMAELIEARPPRTHERAEWNIELVDSPDAVLIEYCGVVATSDSAILDRCGRWVNLAAELIEHTFPNAWKINLRDG